MAGNQKNTQDKPFELDVVSVRLVKNAPVFSERPLKTPYEVVAVMGDIMKEFDREVICVVNLKANYQLINVTYASMGGLNEAMAHPRELLKASILSNAASILLIHCHPSGSCYPSKWDTMTTDCMMKICELVRIPLVDHVIIARDNREFFSFKEKGMMSTPKIKLETDYHMLDIRTPAVAEHGKGR